MRRTLSCRLIEVALASVLAGALPAAAQSVPGIDPVKVKTIPIDNGSAQAPTPGYAEKTIPAPPALTDVPTRKVSTFRVDPSGQMHQP